MDYKIVAGPLPAGTPIGYITSAIGEPLRPIEIGEGGGGSGFNKPLVISDGFYTAADGDVLIFDQSCLCNFPSSSASTVGIQIKARTGVTVVLTPNGTDTIEVTTLTSGQSVLHVPADDTPNNVWEKL